MSEHQRLNLAELDIWRLARLGCRKAHGDRGRAFGWDVQGNAGLFKRHGGRVAAE